MLKYCLNTSNMEYVHCYTNISNDAAKIFELGAFGKFNCDKSYYTRRDNLNNCLLIYTLAGEGYIEYGNAKTTLPPQSMIIINCMNYQYYRTNGEFWSFIWFDFTGDVAYPLVDDLNQDGLFLGEMPKEIFDSYSQQLLRHIKNTSKSSNIEISATIHQLIAQMMSQKIHNSIQTSELPLEKICNFIQRNYSKKISVMELAEISNLSKFYFIKTFKSYTGVTPYQYILNIRIAHAKELLISSNMTISEISERCGFSDSKNFIMNFKKIVHLTPLNFRKKHLPS